MQDLIQALSSLKGKFAKVNNWSGKTNYLLLFDSWTAAEDIAFMLGGQWDGCNGVIVNKYDEVAVNTAARLIGASWCHCGTSLAFITPLRVDELKRRYAVGERNFVNANLRCAVLHQVNLSKINLSWAKLNSANLSGANLNGADLTAADLREANLSGADLTGANLSQADLTGANLIDTKLEGACLRGTKLAETNLANTGITY